MALPTRRRAAAARRDVLRRADLRSHAAGQARAPATRPPAQHPAQGTAAAQRRLRDEDRRPRPSASACQIEALEKRHRARPVGKRIAKLRERQGEGRSRAQGPRPLRRRPEATRGASEGLLARMPDLSQALREAPPASQAPGLRRLRPADRLRQAQAPDRDLAPPSARRSRSAFENAKDLPQEAFRHSKGHSGGGIRTRDLRVMSPTSYLTAPPRGGRSDLPRLAIALRSSEAKPPSRC